MDTFLEMIVAMRNSQARAEDYPTADRLREKRRWEAAVDGEVRKLQEKRPAMFSLTTPEVIDDYHPR